jgi:hypothetical protein
LKKYVDVDHFVGKYIWGRSEQYVLKGNVKIQPTQKKVECFESSISNFFLWKILIKRMMCRKRNCERSKTFNCQEPFTDVVFGKYLV